MTSTPAKTVLLLHALPDGSTHFDWFIDWHIDRHIDSPSTSLPANILTFRIQAFLPSLSLNTLLPAIRLRDHRRIYLDFEGPLSENRGTVRRVATGSSILTPLPPGLRILTTWNSTDSTPILQLWEGHPACEPDPQLWRFVSLPPPQ